MTAHHSVRFGGTPALAAPSDDGVRVLDGSDVDALVAFERHQHVFPAARPVFLARWLTTPGSTGCAIEGADGVEGYGVIRACREGHKLGPLFCADRAAAERLLAALCADVDGPVFVDVPVPNAEASALARDLGLEPVFETARMYRGPDPKLRLDHIFGVTTFELG